MMHGKSVLPGRNLLELGLSSLSSRAGGGHSRAGKQEKRSFNQYNTATYLKSYYRCALWYTSGVRSGVHKIFFRCLCSATAAAPAPCAFVAAWVGPTAPLGARRGAGPGRREGRGEGGGGGRGEVPGGGGPGRCRGGSGRWGGGLGEVEGPRGGGGGARGGGGGASGGAGGGLGEVRGGGPRGGGGGGPRGGAGGGPREVEGGASGRCEGGASGRCRGGPRGGGGGGPRGGAGGASGRCRGTGWRGREGQWAARGREVPRCPVLPLCASRVFNSGALRKHLVFASALAKSLRRKSPFMHPHSLGLQIRTTILRLKLEALNSFPVLISPR